MLKSASKKWKDFKVVLKRKYFNPKLTRKQNICNGCGKRLPGPQWEWLVRHWKTNDTSTNDHMYYQFGYNVILVAK